MDELEEAKKLSAFSYGLYKTRHFQGWDDQEDDTGKSEMWKESPMIQQLRSRSRKRIHEQGSEPVRQTKTKQRESRKEYLAERHREEAMIQTLVSRKNVKLSTLEDVSVSLRNLLLYWISRCLSQKSHQIRTADGIEIKMSMPDKRQRTVLTCVDGSLELPDYQFTFHTTGKRVERDKQLSAAQRETAATLES